MKISLFSTSLTALGLREAIRLTADVGYDAIEILCAPPHLPLAMAESRTDEVRAWLTEVRLPVSALSLSVEYTSEDAATWQANVDETCHFLRLCKKFETNVVKIMPGRPGSAQATMAHWDRYCRAMDVIVPMAESEGVRLALETHLNHLSDSIETAARCLESGGPDVLGVNLDFCNVRTCHEDPVKAIELFGPRIFLTHVKDSLFTTASGEYVPMGRGKMDYRPILMRLRGVGYAGYLSVECLYRWAKEDDPRGAVARDLAVVRGLQIGEEEKGP